MSTTPIYNLTDTWNDVSTTFTAIGIDVTDTASADGSLLFDLKVGGTSLFRVDKSGFIPDTVFGIADDGDRTKRVRFQASGVTTGTTRTLTVPDYDGTIATRAGTETLSNKTLASPAFTGSVSKASRNVLSVYDTAVADYTALKALTADDYRIVMVNDADRWGLFAWRSGDQSANITADPGQGVWVPPDSDNTGASGAWERLLDTFVRPQWFGAAADNSTDDETALERAFSWAATNGYRVELGDEAITYRAAGTVTIPSAAHIVGRAAINCDHTGRGLQLASGAANVTLEGFEVYSTKAEVTVTNVTQADPAVVTLSSGHGLVNGDRIKFREITSGMTELSGRGFTLANQSGDTFELRETIISTGLSDLDSTGYTAWSGTATCNSYAAARTNHRGIFGQSALFDNGVNATYFENIRIKGLRIHGFGAEGIRLDFVRHPEIRECEIYNIGSHGILSLSPIHFDYSENEISEIGPNNSGDNAGYGISVSRVGTYNDATLGSTAASLADSPRPTAGKLHRNRIHNIEDYVALDTHSCEGVSIVGNITLGVAMSFNFEHQSAGAVQAPSQSVVISDNQFTGNDGAYLSSAPGIAIDTGSGLGEIALGVVIGPNHIKHHGKRGNQPLFANGAAIYVTNARGLQIAPQSFENNYRADMYFGTGVDSCAVSGSTSIGLVAQGGDQYMVEVAATAPSVSIDGLTYRNSAGNLLKVRGAATRFWNIVENETVTAGADVVFGANNSVIGGATMMDASTRGVVRLGGGVCPSRAAMALNFSAGIAAKSVSTISLSSGNPVGITTTTSHTYSTGQRVRFQSIVGTTELNNKLWKITVTGATTFTLDDTDGDDFTAYTSGGTIYAALTPTWISQRSREQIIDHIVYNSTGIANIYFKSGVFNQVPACTVTPVDSSGGSGRIFSLSTSRLQAQTVNSSGTSTNYSTVLIEIGGV